jgi:HPt (histidine-containing phosphotransfer) domain-containing protein
MTTMSDTIDKSVFGELQASAGAEFVAELVDTFTEEAPAMLAALRSARAAGDAEAFRRAAHSFKSNALTFGAVALAAAARELELGGIAGDEAIDALQRHYDAAAAALKELRRA